MKKNLILFFALLFIFTGNLYSQSGWFWQNPKPQGNNILGFKMFDSDNGIFINSDNILSTHDGGQSWQRIYTGFPWKNKSISMADENTYFILADSSSIIKTTDRGNSWKYISTQQDIKYSSFIYFKDINTGFAVKIPGNTFSMSIFRTTNGGSNWRNVISNDSIRILSMKFINSQTGYASGVAGVYEHPKPKLFKTVDGGITWDTVVNNFNISFPGIYFINENTGFLHSNALYRTTDKGLNWTRINNNITGTVAEIQFLDEQNGLLTAGNKVYKTVNGGVNWSPSNSVPEVTGLQYIYFSDNNTGYVSSYNKIFKTTNAGNSWTNIAGRNVLNEPLRDISFSGNTGFIISDQRKILKTTDGGDNWQLLNFNSQFSLNAITKLNESTWYIATDNGKIIKTTNTGNSWDSLYSNVYSPTRIEFINEQTGFGVCKYNDFIKTTNGGVNWVITSPFGAQNWAMDFIDAGMGFVGSEGGQLYKTTDGGNAWTQSFPSPGSSIDDIQFIDHYTGFIALRFGYTNYGVMKTTNGGVNWEASLTGIPASDIFFVNERTGFANANGLLYKTTNGGESWHHSETCDGNAFNVSYFTDSLTGWLIGQNGMIIKTTNGGKSVTFEPPVEIPTSFYLFQNYPNPFNPVTTIRYGLPKDLNVKIKIYDILGRLVTQLVNDVQPAGNYSVNFDGSAYSSGIYFYTIETPDFIQSKKMILLK